MLKAKARVKNWSFEPDINAGSRAKFARHPNARCHSSISCPMPLACLPAASPVFSWAHLVLVHGGLLLGQRLLLERVVDEQRRRAVGVVEAAGRGHVAERRRR